MSNVHEFRPSNFLFCIVCCLFSTDRLCEIPEIPINFLLQLLLFSLRIRNLPSSNSELDGRSRLIPLVLYLISRTNVFLNSVLVFAYQ